MRKTFLILTLLGLIFVLAACNGTASEASAENSTGNANDPVNSEQPFTLSAEMKLMLGTVKLDETDYAIDAAQAAELLPLWKALRSLSESDTVAQAEIEALISQIEETLTPDQISALEAMNLTMQDMAGVTETLGLEMGNPGGFGEMTPEMQATMEAARQSGELPSPGEFMSMPLGGGEGLGGGQGPGGGFGGFGAEMDPEARETAIAERGGRRGAGFGMNSALLDGIIEFLEAKIQ